MIAIIDYGVGNLFSLKSSFDKIGQKTMVTGDPNEIKKADKIILPGVGAFEDAARKLRESGLFDLIIEEARSGKPLLGICLGMQLLFDKSFEYGEHEGLGLIPGEIRSIGEVIPKDYKIPHIGWNALNIKKDCPLFKYIKDGDFVYFVHSFYGANCTDSTVATSEYGAPLTAAVSKGNIYGCQFHPEKSGEVGLNILRAFCESED
ncbi:MAG: imidazole glycerol phosphate synthase subunit HisH [Clostridia bacterium]|nr:imidazole glycerol phosphate synthase subunit HisH [Clostridia bacterium]